MSKKLKGGEDLSRFPHLTKTNLLGGENVPSEDDPHIEEHGENKSLNSCELDSQRMRELDDLKQDYTTATVDLSGPPLGDLGKMMIV